MAKKVTTNTPKLWNVQFVDDYAVITVTSIEALDDVDATHKANKLLADYYGINVDTWILNDVEELV